MNELYHGSHIQGLKVISPKESGHGTPYVYAVSELAFAAIFSVPVRNSLIAAWGRLEGIPYFCEKKDSAFNLFYEGKKSSIYTVDSKDFFHREGTWRDEFVSEVEVPILEEIKIDNVKEYLLDLQEQGKFRYISFEEREKYFPNYKEEDISDALKMVEKYGPEETLDSLNQWRPDLTDDVLLRLESQNIS